LISFLSTTAGAGLTDRLELIAVSDDIIISVDKFIIGTEDRYVATIVRSIGQSEVIGGSDASMNEMLNRYDRNSLFLIEKRALCKGTKKFALIERKLALESDIQTAIAVEQGSNAEITNVSPGSIDELVWEGVAGSDGWGRNVLSDDPRPVMLISGDRSPVDAGRYYAAIKKEIGGVFLDRKSISRTDDGVSAVTVESFDVDDEVGYGGMVSHYASQPYVDALYAITLSEYSFTRKSYRQLRFTVFGMDHKIIYSVRTVNRPWVNDDMDPIALPLLDAVGGNLPPELAAELSDDVHAFFSYELEKIQEIVGGDALQDR
jgi:hypothetical protein